MQNKIIFLLFYSFLICQNNITFDDLSDDNNLEEIYESINLLNEDKETINDIPQFEYLDLNIEENFLDTVLSYFGYDYFLNKDKILNIDNLPPPQDYILGPGDEIVISIWGDVENISSYIINRDGKVFIDNIGQVHLTGKTIELAKSNLYDKFSNIYSTLKDTSPTTFFDLSLGTLKSINVNIIGEVNQPGYYSIHPFSTISMSLIINGGVKETGTLRNIQLIRNGEIITEFDLYNSILLGNEVDNIQLKNNDIIYVPYRETTITIDGAINRPAIYEAKNNETLFELINFAGGMSFESTGKVEVNRIVPLKDRDNQDNVNKGYILDYNQISDFYLVDGDNINIRKIYDNSNYVIINGQIKNPGEYPYYEEMTLGELLTIAGGINDSTYLKSMSLKNIEIIRITDDSYYPEIQTINFHDIQSGNIPYINLKNLDYVSVKKNPKFEEPEVVFIEGEVLSPGYYAISNNDETINSIISKSGGLTEVGHVYGIQMYRSGKQVILKEGLDVKVVDGDKIVVPKKTGTVSVQGEVYNPGLVQYVPNKSLNYYLKSTGGYNKNADKKDITVIYANGDIGIKTFWNNPEILDGCTIIVHKKRESLPINQTEVISNIASIITSLSTIIFIIEQQND